MPQVTNGCVSSSASRCIRAVGGPTCGERGPRCGEHERGVNEGSASPVASRRCELQAYDWERPLLVCFRSDSKGKATARPQARPQTRSSAHTVEAPWTLDDYEAISLVLAHNCPASFYRLRTEVLELQRRLGSTTPVSASTELRVVRPRGWPTASRDRRIGSQRVRLRRTDKVREAASAVARAPESGACEARGEEEGNSARRRSGGLHSSLRFSSSMESASPSRRRRRDQRGAPPMAIRSSSWLD